MNRRLLRIAICFASMTVPGVFAQEPARPVVPGEVPATARRFEAARKLAGERKWDAAADEFRKIIEEAGDDLVPLGPYQLIQARWLCHKQVASAPKETLRRYQDRVEAQTNAWLEEGLRERDGRLLQRILTDAFCSRAAERALDALGDLAFERGDFAAAEASWRHLATLNQPAQGGKPEADHPAADMVYPAPQHVDPARARAKQLLARLFRNDHQGYAKGEKAFVALHPDAAGELAGRKGKYAEILTELAREVDALAAPRLPESWPTLGGDASRQRILAKDAKDPRRLMRLCAEGAWRRYDLSEGTRIKEDGPLDKIPFNRIPPPPKEAEELVCCPIIAGDFVYVADSRRVTAYSLRSGEASAWSYECPGLGNAGDGKAGPCSLTAAGDLLYARFGAPPQSTRPGSAAPPSFLVCIDAKSHRELWHAIPGSKPNEPAFFEGAPLVQEGRVYAAVTRFTGNQQTTAIHCYAGQQTAEASPLWRQDVCTAPATKVRSGRLHHLTLAGSNIVYCSHTGTIAAVDSQSGRRAWAIRYPVIDARPADILPSIREDSPCVYADGRLFAAPADADRLYCLDPSSGAPLWERDRIEVTHLLGAANGRLIFTTPNGIRALLADTGLDALSAQSHERGWLQPVDGKISPFGRGLLLGDMVLWPTREYGLLVLNQWDGEQPDDLDPTAIKKIRPGNMAFGNDCLAVADKNELAIYVPPAFLIEERKKEVGEKPQSALAHHRLALAYANALKEKEALAEFEAAERLAEKEGSPGRALRELALSGEHDLLLDSAHRAFDEKKWDKEASILTSASSEKFPVNLRLEALVRLFYLLWTQIDDPDRAIAVCQSVLRSSDLRHGTVEAIAFQSAATWATESIDAITHKYGAGHYGAIENEARKLLETSPKNQRQRTLRQLVDEYPNASVSQEAAIELALGLERSGQWGAANSLYRQVVVSRIPKSLSPLVYLGRARCLERQRCWLHSYGYWGILNREHGKEVVSELDRDRRVDVAAQEKCLRLEQEQLSNVPDSVSLPVVRKWDVPLNKHERLLPISREDNGQPIGWEWLVLSCGDDLICRDARTGIVRWRICLPIDAHAVDCTDDILLVGGRRAIAAVRLDDGGFIWQATPRRKRTFTVDTQWSRDPVQISEELYLSRFRTFEVGLVCKQANGDWIGMQDTWHASVNADVNPPWFPEIPKVAASPTTLSGESLQAALTGRSLFVLIPRNHGQMLQQYQIDDEKFLWPHEVLLSTDPIDVHKLAYDQAHVYCGTRNHLTARDLKDGKVAWQAPLAGPSGQWQVVAQGDKVFAYPAETQSTKFRMSWFGQTLEAEYTAPPEEKPGAGFPIVIHDAKTGTLLQRLNFMETKPPFRVERKRAAHVGLFPEMAMAYTPRGPAPTVFISPRRIVVALEGHAWGLTAGK
jgi:outer membrane protein assembly factor BamB/tetratricopeptide (TPR) repeat protein